jgi:hypothetical protein
LPFAIRRSEWFKDPLIRRVVLPRNNGADGAVDRRKFLHFWRGAFGFLFNLLKILIFFCRHEVC